MTTLHTRPASTLAVGDVLRRTLSPEPHDHEHETVLRVARQDDGSVLVETDGWAHTARRAYPADALVTVVEGSPEPLTDMDAVLRLARQRVALMAQVDDVTSALRHAVVAASGATRKSTLADLAGISRPTLDAWIAQDLPED